MHDNDIPSERWLPVVGFEGAYEISDHGRVRSLARTVIRKNGSPYTVTARILRSTSTRGRKVVNLSPKVFLVHRLVMIAFVGHPPEGKEVAHWDGDPSNNHLGNLRWATKTENESDKIRHGTTNRGEACGTAKLTVAQVLAIRNDDSQTQEEIAARWGVAQSTISRIKSGRRWAHLG